MGHWRQPVLLFILPKKPQEMNDFSSFLAVFFYGLMSQSLFSWSMQTEEASRMLNPSFRAAVSWAGWSDIDEKAELRWKISFFC